MVNGIRTGDPRWFNKECSSKFLEAYRVRQTPEEGRRTYRPKRCGNYHKGEDNCPKTPNDKNRILCAWGYVYVSLLLSISSSFVACSYMSLNIHIYKPRSLFSVAVSIIYFVLTLFLTLYFISLRHINFLGFLLSTFLTLSPPL